MNDPLANVQRRAAQYWFVDGLAEISMGVMLFLLGALFFFWETVNSTPWGLSAVLVIGMAVSYGVRRIIQRIKENSTYPRTGYAAPITGLENKRSFWIAVAFALLLLVVNLFVSLGSLPSIHWPTVFAGLVLGFVIGWTGYVTQMRRFYILAAASLIGGFLLAFLGLEDLQGGGILAAILGVLFLIQGIRTRQAYLRQNTELA